MTHETTTPLVTRHTRTASFAGATSGHGPATWGQTAIRRALAALAPHDDQFNIQWSGRLDEPLPVDVVLRVVGDFFWMHESLRTHLHDHDGGYAQVVRPDGEIRVVEDRVAAGGAAGAFDAVAGDAARRLRDELMAEPFDYAAEWPVRVGLVTSGGSVHHLVLAVSHTAVDGWGVPQFGKDLVALATGASPAGLVASRTSLQPLAEAAYQASDAGRRRDEAARSRTLARMRSAPAAMFPAAAGPRYHQAVLRGRRLPAALDRAADRLGVSSSTILLAAACAALAEAADRDDCVLQVMVNNRFVPGLAGAVSPVAMEGLLYADGLDGPVDDVVRRVWNASMTAYRSAYYDKDRLLQDVALDPSARHDGTCWYNDRRGTGPDPAVRAHPTRRRRLAWADVPANQGGATLALHVLDAPEALDLSLVVDLERIDQVTAEQVLRGTERFVLEAGRGGRGR